MTPPPLRRFLAAGTGVVMAAVMTACATQPSPEVAVRTFLLDWQAGDYEAAARQTTGDVEEVADALEGAHRQLDLAGLRFGLGRIRQNGKGATAEFDVQADLGIGDPVWRYTGEMSLGRGQDGWKIAWSPSVIHPDLNEGERLAVSYDVPDRGEIFDRNDEPLVSEDQLIVFGVVPAELDGMKEGVGALAEVLGEEPGPMLDRVRSAPPEEFQPLVLLRKNDVKTSVVRKAKKIAGVGTTDLTMPLTPTMANGVIGEVAGTAEHNVSSRVVSTYQAGDTVGLNGLQNVFQQRLAGTATTEVVTVNEKGKQTGVLETWPGTQSGSLTTTLDSTAQRVAENSLAQLPGPGYMVALDTRTGEILAAAGSPNDLSNDGAFTKEYEPGEAFTIVSAAAALESGATKPSATVPCDPETTVGDRTFATPNNGGLWEPNFTKDFAFACTTAFAGLGEGVGAEALESAAADFGIDGDWRLSVPTFNGEFIAPESAGDTAAAMVGQDRVAVSPLSMALVAGAVADGTWHAPRLVRDAAEGEPNASRELPKETVEQLREMMRAAVVEGGASRANLSTVPVHGQAASVKQDVGGEETAVQWFVGYQGNVAFAVVAEVDPAMEWDQYAISAGSGFLQNLPYGYVEDPGAGKAGDAGGAAPGAPGPPGVPGI
ncbi:penicillin-binding transpeptidase domain-containing protein [Nocardiopsis rhodophaea]|uniref:penicillin-binding transpeptidase domain-containing protein n=1 Tax=Nocardiopsis rhodophaea TaxID=280238 RepID=UPI0031D0A0B4